MVRQKKKVMACINNWSILNPESENLSWATEKATMTIRKTIMKLTGLDLLKILVIIISFCIFVS